MVGVIGGELALFREPGFEVLDYLELPAPPGSKDQFHVPTARTQRWPAEHVWMLRRR
ncbi:MAG TPA: hypothetical protein VIW29_16915 [Polyangiaceae bacterium]